MSDPLFHVPTPAEEDAAFFKKMEEIVPVYREAMGYRRGGLADAAGRAMPTFSLPAAIALAIIAGCAGYFLAWIATGM